MVVNSHNLLFVLLALMLPEPLLAGTLVQELDKHTAAVLRQLAFDSRFDSLWQWIQYVLVVPNSGRVRHTIHAHHT
jgi:hypothetical protein